MHLLLKFNVVGFKSNEIVNVIPWFLPFVLCGVCVKVYIYNIYCTGTEYNELMAINETSLISPRHNGHTYNMLQSVCINRNLPFYKSGLKQLIMFMNWWYKQITNTCKYGGCLTFSTNCLFFMPVLLNLEFVQYYTVILVRDIKHQEEKLNILAC